MAETFSTMLPLGTIAPDFKLVDTRTNEWLTFPAPEKTPSATVILFICNHCPYVKHIQTQLIDIINIYQKKGIQFIAINSNNVEKYPADSPENMQKEAEWYNYTFPYLYDETQSVAKAYQAACTPDFYIFDKNLQCVYRGRFDDATPGNTHPVTGKDLTAALDQLLKNQPVSTDQNPSIGCNIKWK